ncbi:MAG: hypothetical protein EHM43_03710 [Ignavibacteriae bacterium]|nr:MAG: hypothetical protein EHM43_03710 [Ignavibacteriota bacterium]
MLLRIFLAVAILTLAAATATAQNADVNAERVSMDLQMLRAIDGRASLGSMAVWPQSTVSLTQQSQDTSDAFARYVRSYYGRIILDTDTTDGLEAGVVDSRFRGLSLNDGVMRFQGDIALMFRPGYYDNDTIADPFLLMRPSIRFMGSLHSSFGYFLDLSNGVRLSGDPKMIAKTDPTLSRITKFNIEDSAFFDRYVGYVQFQSEYLRIRFGREAMQFGFSPIDNYVHSIEAPLLDGLLIDVPYKSVRFTMTHSAANGVDTAGNAVPSKYVATHRLAFDPTPWLSLAVSDMIVYWGRGLDLVYLNPLAFFVSAGLSTEERNTNDNSLLSFDAAVRPFNGTMVYGTLLIDDLSYSTLGDTSYVGNNNKFAYQLGVSQLLPGLGSPRDGMATLISAEYARIDPFTFTHRSMNASYSTFSAPVGYDMQPNSDRWAFQLRAWFTPRTFIRLDVDYTRHGENILDSIGNIQVGDNPRFPGNPAPIGNVGGDLLRGDGDDLVGNSFLRGNVSHQRRVRLWFSAEWLTNIFTDIRFGYTSRTGGNTPENFVFGSFEIRVGY